MGPRPSWPTWQYFCFEDDEIESSGASSEQRDEPFVPLDGGVVYETGELLGKRATGEGNGEAALLLDGLFLRLDNELGEAFHEFPRGGERTEDGCIWRGV